MEKKVKPKVKPKAEAPKERSRVFVLLVLGILVLTLGGAGLVYLFMKFPAKTAPEPSTLITSPQTPIEEPSPSPTPTPTPTEEQKIVQKQSVDFDLEIISIDGSGLSRTVTAELSNLGDFDAHNVWVKFEAFSDDERIELNGQNYLREDIGLLKAGSKISKNTTISVGFTDGLKIQNKGAEFVVTVHSDEKIKTISEHYYP